MNGHRVALDTNRAIAVLNDEPGIRDAMAPYREVYLPAIVVGELMFGALNSTRSEENMARIRLLESRCQPLAVTGETASVYARIRLDLKRQGNPRPENDLWIAAVCIENNLPLATADHYFNNVDGLVIIAPTGEQP